MGSPTGVPGRAPTAPTVAGSTPATSNASRYAATWQIVMKCDIDGVAVLVGGRATNYCDPSPSASGNRLSANMTKSHWTKPSAEQK